MGISGLLPVLRNVIERNHVKKYSGQKVAVDTYCWLHKGCYGCAMELCTGAPTDKSYINYCVDRVNMLLSYGVTPVMVFDGANLPMKEGTECSRKSSREEYRLKGQQALRVDNRSLAFDCFQRAVDVTPEMANRLIKVLQRKGVECIVAPYEADAQLAFLNIKGYVAAVISEDSDIIAFGARAVLFKMDKDGFVEEYRQKLLGACSSIKLSGWEPERVTQMCIFAGCDYLKSLSGMGVKKAHQAVSSCLRAPLDECYIKAIARLRLDGASIPANFVEDFRRAYLTFQHQRVFDPTLEAVVPLKPLPPELETAETDFLGRPVADELARAIASGRVHPSTYEPFPEPKARAARASSSSAAAAAAAPRPLLQKSLSFPSQKQPPADNADPEELAGTQNRQGEHAAEAPASSAEDSEHRGERRGAREAGSGDGSGEDGKRGQVQAGAGKTGEERTSRSGGAFSSLKRVGQRAPAQGRSTQSTINAFMSGLLAVSGNAKKEFRPPRQAGTEAAGEEVGRKRAAAAAAGQADEDPAAPKARRLQTRNPYVDAAQAQAQAAGPAKSLTSRFFPKAAPAPGQAQDPDDGGRGHSRAQHAHQEEEEEEEEEEEGRSTGHASLEALRYQPRPERAGGVESGSEGRFKSSLLVPSPVLAGKRLARLSLPPSRPSQTARCMSLDSLAGLAHRPVASARQTR